VSIFLPSSIGGIPVSLLPTFGAALVAEAAQNAQNVSLGSAFAAGRALTDAEQVSQNIGTTVRGVSLGGAFISGVVITGLVLKVFKRG